MTYHVIMALSLALFPMFSMSARAETLRFAGEEFSLSDYTPSAGSFKIKSVSTPKAGILLPKPIKKWTIILYLNGRNNLERRMYYKVADLERLGSDDNINIVAELGVIKRPWSGTRRFYVRKNANSDTLGYEIVASSVLEKKEKADMGNYRDLVDYITWVKHNFPAEHYLISVANHGGAWIDKNEQQQTVIEKGISYDDVSGNYITTKELGIAMQQAGGADILLLDGCLMQAMEVASEVKETVGYLIGSEATAYTKTFQYHLMLAQLKKTPSMQPEQLARAMLTAISANAKSAQTVSLLDTSRMAGAESLASNFARSAMAIDNTDGEVSRVIRDALNRVVRYDYIHCTDFYDFVNLVQTGIRSAVTSGKIAESDKTLAFCQAAEDLKSYISNKLILVNDTHGGEEYVRSRGVSVYLPAMHTKFYNDKWWTEWYKPLPGDLKTQYSDLNFDKATGWSDFVSYLLTLPYKTENIKVTVIQQ